MRLNWLGSFVLFTTGMIYLYGWALTDHAVYMPGIAAACWLGSAWLFWWPGARMPA
jgi:hypothetical protein